LTARRARRERRLVNEGLLLRAAFGDSLTVDVAPVGWDPFEAYRLRFSVPGVVLEDGMQPTISRHHDVRLELGPDYPRRPPTVVTETDVFHPNLGMRAGDAVVIDQEWTAACTLVDVVSHIGEMLQYQDYDLEDPANEIAAAWARENAAIFPIGHAEIEVRVAPQ
jgi:hypothetical protein